jgi:nucleoid DNA-binding protein
LSRQRLIKQLKDKNPKLNQSELESVIDVFSKSISNTLKSGNTVEIRGLGRWYCKRLKENYNARNPATNKLIYKPERVKIRFKVSKKLNKIINE